MRSLVKDTRDLRSSSDWATDKTGRRESSTCLPEKNKAIVDETTNRMWHHLFLMVCEIAHAPRKIHRTNWYDFYSIKDRQLILKVVLDARPKIMVTGHFGILSWLAM